MAPAEVKHVGGYIGNFHVTVENRPRYVDAGRCNGCGACSKVCPIEVPNEFEANIAPRKAIGVPHGQAVPGAVEPRVAGLVPAVAVVERQDLVADDADPGREVLDVALRCVLQRG